jgi:hypothetical protein
LADAPPVVVTVLVEVMARRLGESGVQPRALLQQVIRVLEVTSVVLCLSLGELDRCPARHQVAGWFGELDASRLLLLTDQWFIGPLEIRPEMMSASELLRILDNHGHELRDRVPVGEGVPDDGRGRAGVPRWHDGPNSGSGFGRSVEQRTPAPVGVAAIAASLQAGGVPEGPQIFGIGSDPGC